MIFFLKTQEDPLFSNKSFGGNQSLLKPNDKRKNPFGIFEDWDIRKRKLAIKQD
jgi:hypothetical protein